MSRRQPGSVFKPFVYLTAFEQAAADGRTDITPATIVDDEPETFEFDDQVWTPENYEDEYDGPITFRRALAHSRNLATIHVAERAGYDSVAALWKKLGVGNAPKAYPVDRARRVRGDAARDRDGVHAVPERRRSCGRCRHPDADHARRQGRHEEGQRAQPRTVARADTTFLVTNMMRSVLNEGTARGRARPGLHARRRGQDRHDQRSARRVVRRLHAGAADGGLGRLRRQPAARPERRAGGAADLDAVHEQRALAGRAERASVRQVPERRHASLDIDPPTPASCAHALTLPDTGHPRGVHSPGTEPTAVAASCIRARSADGPDPSLARPPI